MGVTAMRAAVRRSEIRLRLLVAGPTAGVDRTRRGGIAEPWPVSVVSRTVPDRPSGGRLTLRVHVADLRRSPGVSATAGSISGLSVSRSLTPPVCCFVRERPPVTTLIAHGRAFVGCLREGWQLGGVRAGRWGRSGLRVGRDRVRYSDINCITAVVAFHRACRGESSRLRQPDRSRRLLPSRRRHDADRMLAETAAPCEPTRPGFSRRPLRDPRQFSPPMATGTMPARPPCAVG